MNQVIAKMGNMIRHAYIFYLRPILPISSREITYNNVEVRPYRLFDRLVNGFLPPNQGGHRVPEKYEEGLVTSLQNTIKQGDKVVIIGGGLGVTAVTAGNAAGSSGEVVVYEGAKHMSEHLIETINLNQPNNIQLHNKLVTNSGNLEGPTFGAGKIQTNELEQCDVLQLDCEGAEITILENLEIEPRTIIVETHGNEKAVIEILSKLGYKVKSKQLAECGPYKDICEEQGVVVLVAEKYDYT